MIDLAEVKEVDQTVGLANVNGLDQSRNLVLILVKRNPDPGRRTTIESKMTTDYRQVVLNLKVETRQIKTENHDEIRISKLSNGNNFKIYKKIHR